MNKFENIQQSKKIENLKTLQEIKNLKSGWNGYQADSIPIEVVELASDILMILDVQPEIYPTGRKTIQMQYELPDRSYLEFEIHADKIDVLIVLKRIYDNAIQYNISQNQYHKLNDIVNDFTNS